jgi:NAD(P)-dependent dehydrogenase (short-subunit alcohol dehydrogenase family)
VPAALITGAARRIGARLAVELARAGYDVALHHRSGAEEAAQVAREIEGLGRRCARLPADLADVDARDALVPRAAAALGPLTALVNSASLFRYDTLQTLTQPSWDDHLAANFTAPVFLSRAFAAQVPDGGRGVIVNLLDFKLFSPNPDYFAYTAGKAGLGAMIAPMAMALAPRVRVCGLAPGLTLPSGPQTQDAFEAAHNATPVTAATPDDLARALRFILETPSYTGQILTVDGGESLLRRPRDVAYGAPEDAPHG